MKKNLAKKVLASFAAACILALSVPFSAFAADSPTGGNITITLPADLQIEGKTKADVHAKTEDLNEFVNLGPAYGTQIRQMIDPAYADYYLATPLNVLITPWKFVESPWGGGWSYYSNYSGNASVRLDMAGINKDTHEAVVAIFTLDFAATGGAGAIAPPCEIIGYNKAVVENGYLTFDHQIAPKAFSPGTYSYSAVLIKHKAAQPTPPSEPVVYNPVGSINQEGSTLPAGAKLNVKEITNEQLTSTVALAKAKGLKGEMVLLKDISMVGADGKPIKPDGNTSIKVTVPGVTAKDKVSILHLKDNGESEVLPATAYEGYITFKPTSFSLFGVVVEKGAATSTPPAGSATSTPTTTNNNTTQKSPQTGILT